MENKPLKNEKPVSESDDDFVFEYNVNPRFTNRTTYVLEDDIWILLKNSRDTLVLHYLQEDNERAVRKLLKQGLTDEAVLKALVMAVDLEFTKYIDIFLSHTLLNDKELYEECLKRLFIKYCTLNDLENLKMYLERLIENVTGVLTDDTGKTTLQIAVENNPADIITILQNYGFHRNSIEYAFRCLRGD